jgi:hypothetical protein
MRARSLIAGATVVSLALVGTASADVTPRQWDPLVPPTDVTALVAAASESVVLVQCGDQFATGWSAAVSLSKEAQGRGYRSMIATDAQIMDRCRGNGDRTVEIRHMGSEYTGYVWGWDEGQPFISVMTKARIPMLPWSRIARPVANQWAVSVTSEGGNGVSFAEQRVASVGARTLALQTVPTSQQVGSPIVDSQGNVLGMVASRSGVIAVAGGPEMCFGVIRCSNPDSIWLIFTIPRVVRSPEVAPLRAGLRVSWAPPLGADAAGPVDYYEYRVGAGTWRQTTRTAVVIKPLPRGRVTSIEVRAVNSYGSGASIFVRGTPL